MLHKPVILVFTGRYLPGYKAGGILRNIINTVDFLGDDFEFRIVTRDRDLGDEVGYMNVKVDEWQRVGNAYVYYLSQGAETLKAIFDLIKETQHDVIFLTSYFDPLTIKTLANIKNRKFTFSPVIVAPFGEFAWASLRQKFLKKLIFIILARLVGLYKGVIWRVSSSYEAVDLIHVMNISEKSVFITGDLPIKTLPQLKPLLVVDNTDSSLRLLKIIFLSRISREKNLHIALKILHKVQASVLFDIYGPVENRSYWAECQALIAEVPANVTVRYCGDVHPNKVLEVFSSYDLFLFPSGGEAYGNVIAEALIVGTPVLISTLTPWRDLQSNGMGWDIELSNINAFVSVIEDIALQSEYQHLNMRRLIQRKILGRLFDPDVLESNRRLFASQIK